MAVASRVILPLENSLLMKPFPLHSEICLSRSSRSAFISPTLYSERSGFICVIHGFLWTRSLYPSRFLIRVWSANFLWSSLTRGYFRSSMDGSTFSLSVLYSSNWRLSLRSILSMAYSL